MVHRHAATLVLAVLKSSTDLTQTRFLAAFTESISRMKDTAHARVLSGICTDLFVDCVVDPKSTVDTYMRTEAETIRAPGQ